MLNLCITWKFSFFLFQKTLQFLFHVTEKTCQPWLYVLVTILLILYQLIANNFFYKFSYIRVIRRIGSLLSRQAQLMASAEASMRQAKSASETAEKLMKEQTVRWKLFCMYQTFNIILSLSCITNFSKFLFMFRIL